MTTIQSINIRDFKNCLSQAKYCSCIALRYQSFKKIK